MPKCSVSSWSTSRILSTLLIFAGLGSSPIAFAKVEFSGRATLMGEYFPADPLNPSPTLQKHGAIFEVEPVLQIPSDNYRFRLRGIAGWDYTYTDADDRKILIPEEAFLETRRGKWNFLVGYNTFTWGVTDVLNPLDMINPRNYRNPFQPTKVGVPAVSIAYGGDSSAFELVYIPKQGQPVLPPKTSRSLPRDASLGEYANVGYPLSSQPLNFYYDSVNEYGKPFDNNYGARVRQSIGKLEAHVIGWEGAPAFPELQPVVEINIPPGEISSSIGIRQHFERIRMGGLGLVYSLESVIIRFAYSKTWKVADQRNTLTQTASLPETGVLALEKSASMGGMDWTFLLQYAAQKDNSGKSPSVFSLNQVFDGSIMPGVRIAYGVDFSMLIGGIYNPSSKATIATADAQYRLSDQWQLKLTGVSVGGGKLLDSVKSASRVELGVSYNW